MFSTFTTEHGTLIIRSEDIRRIEDMKLHGQGTGDAATCYVVWQCDDGTTESRAVLGTAQENYDRIKREAMGQYDAAQDRAAQRMRIR